MDTSKSVTLPCPSYISTSGVVTLADPDPQTKSISTLNKLRKLRKRNGRCSPKLVGTAMGTRLARDFVIIYIADFERLQS